MAPPVKKALPSKPVVRTKAPERPAVEEGQSPATALLAASGPRISLAVGKTINVGNYESIRVDVGVSIDVGDTAHIDRRYEMLKSYAFDRLNELIGEVQDAIK